MVDEKRFIGVCRGGPYDGKTISSKTPNYMMATSLRVFHGKEEIEYACYAYVLGQWIFHPDVDYTPK
jgi:hypothetical protein